VSTVWLLASCALVASGCKSRPQAGDTGNSQEPSVAANAANAVAPPPPLDHAHAHAHDADHDAIVAECPVEGPDARDPAALLHMANQCYSAGEFTVAYECAAAAADMNPRSIDAHHVRAAAAAALGRHELAQTAFIMALALDPDDPETLAASADFYINVMPSKRRDTILIGLEQARRGRARAVVRRRTGRELRARLALLEAQAYNDLGQPEEALERIEEVLDLSGDLAEAEHERGVALFGLCKFEEARESFQRVLSSAPHDAYAHHHLGLVYERLGRLAESAAHFARAREIAPAEFWAPVAISDPEFRAEVEIALAELPVEVRIILETVDIEVADLPALSDLSAVNPPFSPTILGLFRGLPLGVDAQQGSKPAPPRAIVLYRNNLARAVKTRAELDRQIRRTLMHEIGHLSGLDEDALRRRGLD
jgi:tetratricopeptide (TPR) repeat protein